MLFCVLQLESFEEILYSRNQVPSEDPVLTSYNYHHIIEDEDEVYYDYFKKTPYYVVIVIFSRDSNLTTTNVRP